MKVQTEKHDPSVTRIAIDYDADGAYAVITRPGQAAELIRLPDVDRVATEAMVAALAMRGQGVVILKARWPTSLQKTQRSDDGPPEFIGARGE